MGEELSKKEQENIDQAIAASLQEQPALTTDDQADLVAKILSLEEQEVSLKSKYKELGISNEFIEMNEVRQEFNKVKKELETYRADMESSIPNEKTYNNMIASQEALLKYYNDKKAASEDQSVSEMSSRLDEEDVTVDDYDTAMVSSIGVQEQGELPGLVPLDDELSDISESSVSHASNQTLTEAQDLEEDAVISVTENSQQGGQDGESVEFDVTSVTYEEELVDDGQLLSSPSRATEASQTKKKGAMQSFLSKLKKGLATRPKRDKTESARSTKKNKKDKSQRGYQSLS